MYNIFFMRMFRGIMGYIHCVELLLSSTVLPTRRERVHYLPEWCLWRKLKMCFRSILIKSFLCPQLLQLTATKGRVGAPVQQNPVLTSLRTTYVIWNKRQHIKGCKGIKPIKSWGLLLLLTPVFVSSCVLVRFTLRSQQAIKKLPIAMALIMQ